MKKTILGTAVALASVLTLGLTSHNAEARNFSGSCWGHQGNDLQGNDCSLSSRPAYGTEAEIDAELTAIEAAELESALDESFEIVEEAYEEALENQAVVEELVTTYFATGDARITPAAMKRLQSEVAKTGVAGNNDTTVELRGFADPTGPTELNVELAEKRAEAVKKALVQLGVPERKISMNLENLREDLQAYNCDSGSSNYAQCLESARKAELLIK